MTCSRHITSPNVTFAPERPGGAEDHFGSDLDPSDFTSESMEWAARNSPNSF